MTGATLKPWEPGEGPQRYIRELEAEVERLRAELDRALSILHRMATENTGWRAVFRRWYYSDEPLRNDAANLVRDAGFGMMQPINTRLVSPGNEMT